MNTLRAWFTMHGPLVVAVGTAIVLLGKQQYVEALLALLAGFGIVSSGYTAGHKLGIIALAALLFVGHASAQGPYYAAPRSSYTAHDCCILPWRSMVERRLDALERGGGHAPGGAPSPAPAPAPGMTQPGMTPQQLFGQNSPYAPQYQLPMQGAPQYQLPMQGAPQQQLPMQGAPLYILPIAQAPQQQLAPQGQPPIMQQQQTPQTPPQKQLPPAGTPQTLPPGGAPPQALSGGSNPPTLTPGGAPPAQTQTVPPAGYMSFVRGWTPAVFRPDMMR